MNATVDTRLTDKQVEEVLGLLKGSDSVELKATVPESDIRSATVRLGLDVINAEIRQVVFFDTPSLALSRAGVVVRARRIQGGLGDTVIKLRPVKPKDIPPEIRDLASVKVEVDAMPRGFVCSASMKGKTSATDVRNVILGKGSIQDLFSKKQREFYQAHAPKALKLNGLAILGPINILKLRFETKALNHKFVAEQWFYPDGTRVLELSTKCTPADAFQVAAQTRNFLAKHGIDLTAEQQPKTQKALKHFSSLWKQSKKQS